MPLTELVRLGGGKVKITVEGEGGPQDFICRLLTLTDLVDFEAQFGPFEEVFPSADNPGQPAKRLPAMRFLLWCLLRHHQKDLTVQQAGELFTLEDMAEGGVALELLNQFMPRPKGAVPPEEAAGTAAGGDE